MTQNIVTLTETKSFMRYPAPSAPSDDDAMICFVLNGLADTVRYHCGDVDGIPHIEKRQGGSAEIGLWHAPIVSVESVIESWGYFSAELDFYDATDEVDSIYAYSIDSYEQGVITRRMPGGIAIPFQPAILNGIEITYRSGYAVIPDGLKLAMLQLFQHLWSNSQFRSVAQSGANIAYDAVSGQSYSRDPNVQSLDWGLPYSLIQQLDAFRRSPVIC